MTPDLSILVFTRNDGPFLQGCLGTLIAEPPALRFEVLIFDNLSTDDTADQLDFLCPALPSRRFRAVEDTSFSVGNNRLAEEARGEILLIVNADTVPRAEILERGHQALLDPRCVLAGPRLRYPDGEDQPNGWYLPTLHQRLRERLGHPREVPPGPSTATPVGWLMGCCLFARRADWRSMGGFDPRFWFHGTDLELGARMGRKGEVRRLEDVELIHHGHRGWDRQRRQATRAATTRWIRRDFGALHGLLAGTAARLADWAEG